MKVSVTNSMNQMLDPLNLLLLAAAIFAFWRLYSVLGTRTGNERTPFDPRIEKPDARETLPPAPVTDLKPASSSENLPKPVRMPEETPPVWAGFAPEDSPVAASLERIAAADRGFAPKRFLEGAKIAYEMVVEAFAKGDKSALKPLLGREVFDGFSRAIDSRNASGQKLVSRFVGIDKAEIIAAELVGSRAALTLRLVSEMISSTTDRDGKIVDGDPNEVRQVTDVWTFERDVTSQDPNWKLVATEEPA